MDRHVVDAGLVDVLAGLRRVDDVVAAREDAHVGGTRVEDDDVAELLAAHADRLAAVGLGLRGARDGLADLRVGPGGQTGAVEAAGLGAAPHVRGADLRARGVDDLLAGGDGRSGGGGAVDDLVGARDGAGDALDVLDVLDIRDVEGTDTRNVDRGGRRGRRACLVNRLGVQPCYQGALPVQLAAMNMTNINVQLLTIEAAATLKKEHIYQAVMLDPHASSELSIDEIVAMCDELIEVHGDWMPKYK